MDNRKHGSLSAIGIAALLCVGVASMATADGNQSSAFPDTGELGKQWWELVMSIPGPQNPFLDDTGASCGIGQRGNTWFLYSSSFGPRVDLKCTIPAGKTIFLAVVAGICVPYPGETIAQNIEFCREGSDLTDLLVLRINGKARNDLIERRALYKPFALPAPEENVFGFAPGIFVAVHDGFFAKVPPLSPGHHTIRVRGAASTVGFSTDTLYRLHIVKPDKALPTFPGS
jgi:hypothetical protein